MRIALKELRETRVCLKILDLKQYLKPDDKLKKSLTESIELISIFVKSISMAEKNLKSQ